MRRAVTSLVMALSLPGCALAPALPPETGPDPFVIQKDLAGQTVARGSFSAINGVKRTFTAYLDGKLEGDSFTLFERFEYDDGEKDQKTWVLMRQPNGEWLGTREDVVGKARGWQDGRAFRLSYDVVLPNADGSPGMQVHFQDVMVKRPDGVVLNQASVGWWGFGVAGVTLEIRRP